MKPESGKFLSIFHQFEKMLSNKSPTVLTLLAK